MKGVSRRAGELAEVRRQSRESARRRCLEAARGSTKQEGAPQTSLSPLLDTKPSVHRGMLCGKGAERFSELTRAERCQVCNCVEHSR